MAKCLIGVGANLGNRSRTIAFAAEQLCSETGVTSLQTSSNYASHPTGGPVGQGDFLNSAFLLETSLPAEALLRVLQHVEQSAGHVKQDRWGARHLDLDLLLYDDSLIEHANLIVPHPRMSFRRFVLNPSADIAPEMIHPANQLTVRELLHRLDTLPNYVAIGGGTYRQRSSLARDIAAQSSSVKHLLAEPPHRSEEDSPSRVLQAAIEFLVQQRDHLQSLEVASTDAGWISDFWLNETRAIMSRCLPQTKLIEFGKQWHRLADGVVEPMLVVLLDASPELLEAAQQAKLPVLKLNSQDEDWNRQEVSAALEAMK